MDAVHEALSHLNTEFAGYDNAGFEIAGFVWFQSWNEIYDDGHHWFSNAESYFLIGDAMGKAMIELLTIAAP